MDNFAERYEAVLVPVIFQPWAEEIVRRAAPQDGEHILDLACGTGILTREVMRSGISPGGLTGMDLSADMLAVARVRATQSSLQAEWVEGSASQLPFSDDRFDLTYCQQALQFFPDRLAALRELRRVMRNSGRVVFSVQQDLERNPLLKAQADTLDKYVGREAGDAVRAICSLPDAGVIQALFEDAGFGDVEIESVTLTLHHPEGRAFAAGAMGGMHTGDKLAQASDRERQQSIDDFLTGLGEYYDGTAIRFPHASHVITARA